MHNVTVVPSPLPPPQAGTARGGGGGGSTFSYVNLTSKWSEKKNYIYISLNDPNVRKTYFITFFPTWTTILMNCTNTNWSV